MKCNVGAPIELRPKLKQSSSSVVTSTPRITFLVNLWLYHHPHDVGLLPNDILDTLTLTPVSAPLSIQLVPDTESIEDFKVSAKVIRDERKMTELTIPFITEESNWGIGADETGLHLKIWMPRSVLRGMKSNLHILYPRADVAAYLEYEVDEEAEEALAGEFEGMVYCGEVSGGSGLRQKKQQL